ncbi:MAG: DNA-directed RNA polymerase subunit H [Candidatus Aenigmatarchaeota archaeon]
MAENEEKQIDIFQNILVPKHEIMSAKEKQELIEKFNIGLEQLPRISKKDPAVIIIGAKSGDVIRITRDSDVAGESLYYRLVK